MVLRPLQPATAVHKVGTLGIAADSVADQSDTVVVLLRPVCLAEEQMGHNPRAVVEEPAPALMNTVDPAVAVNSLDVEGPRLHCGCIQMENNLSVPVE